MHAGTFFVQLSNADLVNTYPRRMFVRTVRVCKQIVTKFYCNKPKIHIGKPVHEGLNNQNLVRLIRDAASQEERERARERAREREKESERERDGARRCRGCVRSGGIYSI